MRLQNIAVNHNCLGWELWSEVSGETKAAKERELGKKMGGVIHRLILNWIATKSSFSLVISYYLLSEKALIFQCCIALFQLGGQQTHSVKGQKANILGFEGHRAPVATIQLCLTSRKTTTDNK